MLRFEIITFKMKHFFWIFIGGGLGSVCRYILGKFLNDSSNGIPYGTFLANILGSLLIGLILGLSLKNNTIEEHQVLFLASGFCGGFTTFSTFAYENHIFLKSGDFGSFAIYTIASFVVGFLSVFGGMYLVKFF